MLAADPIRVRKRQVPAPILGGRLGRGYYVMRPLAKYELLCYDISRKWAGGSLLFLGACRITYVLGESIENPLVAGGRGDVPPGPLPSEEAWDQIECRFETSSLEA